MKKLAIFGTGGFAKELLDLAIDQGYSDICFLEKQVHDQQMLLGFHVLPESELFAMGNMDFAIGIADPAIRKKISQLYPELNYPNLVHSQASLGYGIDQVLQCCKGVVIAAGARITNSCHFGDFVIVSFNSTIGHDCKLNNFVSVMPGANVSGCIELKEAVYIGTNATILPGQSPNNLRYLAEYSTIGAGSLVLKDTQAYTTYIGSPARELEKK